MPVFIVSALILGLVSSLHCLGMCGPLVIGILPKEASSFKKAVILFFYHAGRLLVYGLLGVVVGLLGQKLFLPRFQQFLSIALGVAILAWVLTKYLKVSDSLQWGLLNHILSKLMGHFLVVKSDVKYILLGGLNGLLPCGMVYIALAGAFSLNNLWNSFLFMQFFGLGTLPLLVLTSGVGSYLKTNARKLVVQLQPAFLILFAGILILRGLNLGIPYLSPEVVKSDKAVEMECCKKP